MNQRRSVPQPAAPGGVPTATRRSTPPLTYALCFAAAVVSSNALVGMVRGDLDATAGSVVLVPVVAAVLCCMLRVVRGMDRRIHWFAGPLAVLLSGCMMIGRNLFLTDTGGWTSSETWTPIILAIPAIWALLAVAIDWLTPLAERVAWTASGTGTRANTLLARYRTFGTAKPALLLLALWAIIFAVWLIGYMGAFPGIYGYDSIYQVRMYYLGGANVSNHHPIVHTYLLGWCVVTIGERLLGSAAAGLVVYCVLQMLVMSLIYAYMSARLNKLSGPVASIIAAVFFAFVPYHMLLAFSATKDSLFAAFFALGVFQTYDIALRIQRGRESGRTAAIPVRTWVGYGCVLFAGCLLRNNALYAVIVLLAAAAVLLRRQWEGFVATLVAIVVAWGLFTGPVYKVLDVQKEGAAAMLSVPAQQLTRAALLNADEISPEDMALIKEYMPTIDTYQARISDHVVFPFNNAKYAEDKGAFYKLWARVGKAAPGTYLDAFLLLNAGNWYPDMGYPIPDGYHPYLEYGFPGVENDYNAHQADADADSWIFVPLQPKWRWASEQLSDFARGDWQTVPGAVLLCNPGVYIWLTLVAAAVVARRRQYVLLLPLALMVLYWGTLLLAPTILFRYSYALAAALPVIVGLLCGGSDGDRRAEPMV